MRKSGSSTFLLQRSASMEVALHPNSSPPYRTSTTTLKDVPRESLPSIEFPTSPQPTQMLGKGILHYSHLQHPLAQITLPELFTCAGCKEYGAGMRFACQQCDFQLHDFCALSPPALKDHPLHGQHQLVLHSKSKPGGILWPRCDVCGKPTKGFTFRCSACNFQMHPCCAMLSSEMNFPVHGHSLKLLPPATSSSSGSGGGDPAGFVCGVCKRKRSGRAYRCTVCDYHLHAVCAKTMINGLRANGIEDRDRPSMMGTVVRLASQVVIEFIGGLIDGIGEGVGQAFIQDITRGRRCNSRRRTV